jgi:membrane-associated protease RseP (regulator of RpoE activity)
VKSATGVVALAPATAHASGVIGVEVDYLTKNVTTNPVIAVQRAGAMLGTTTVSTLTGIGQVFSPHGLESFYNSVIAAGRHTQSTGSSGATSSSSSSSSSGQLLSIYGAISIGAQAAQQDVSLLLYLLVAINLFVGIINLFPMLPLDGGHVLVAVYERVRSRRNRPYHADVTKMMPIVYVFLAFIVVMGVSALYANIVQPVSLPGR